MFKFESVNTLFWSNCNMMVAWYY